MFKYTFTKLFSGRVFLRGPYDANLCELRHVWRDVRGIHRELYGGYHRDLRGGWHDFRELRRGVRGYRVHVHVRGLGRKVGSECSNRPCR